MKNKIKAGIIAIAVVGAAVASYAGVKLYKQKKATEVIDAIETAFEVIDEAEEKA